MTYKIWLRPQRSLGFYERIQLLILQGHIVCFKLHTFLWCLFLWLKRQTVEFIPLSFSFILACLERSYKVISDSLIKYCFNSWSIYRHFSSIGNPGKSIQKYSLWVLGDLFFELQVSILINFFVGETQWWSLQLGGYDQELTLLCLIWRDGLRRTLLSSVRLVKINTVFNHRQTKT